jgi:hypothetical protein
LHRCFSTKFPSDERVLLSAPYTLQKALKKVETKRKSSLSKLKTPDGQGFSFSKATRATIPTSVLTRILELNSMDEALFQAGKLLLEERLAQQRASGELDWLHGAAASGKQASAGRRVPDRGGVALPPLMQIANEGTSGTEEDAQTAQHEEL